MKSVEFASPTIVLITDRADLDDQLSGQFTNAKGYIGDDTVISVESRENLRNLLQGRKSGGVFLTTIHKFTEDIRLLTDRDNVICISDEAHRSQVNLDQKVTVTSKGVIKTFGFAKYLHDSLPNATYVGFTGTPIDATYDVFGELVDAYSMADSVRDKITVRIVYEGRAARVILNNEKLQDIEKYYKECADAGANEYQIEESKRANTNLNLILGDPDRIKAVAEDFVAHYEKRMEEGATVKGKAMFVCSNRENAFKLYKAITALRPEWNVKKICDDGVNLTEEEKRKIMPLERIKMVMTRGQDDEQELYDLLGPKEYRKELDRQFKVDKSNFRVAIVVDMWLTGFDVPSLDTLYIDKPVQKHTLIQTISRVNRRFEGKDKGLVVDYIGIKSQMDEAINQYGEGDGGGSGPGIEGINKSITIVKDHLELLKALFHKFDTTPYFQGSPMSQLKCLKRAAEFVQTTEKQEKWYMYTVRRLKLAYDICCGSEAFTQSERDHVHFYLAIRSIIFKLTKGDSPDISIMNAKVQAMIEEALKSNGVEEVIKLCDNEGEIDIFDEKYMECLCDISEPNTKLKLLLKLLKKAIDDFSKTNKFKSIKFSEEFSALVDRYNDREDDAVWRENIVKDFTNEIMDMINALKKETESFREMGINFEKKAFYDILKGLTVKYEFEYPDDKLLELSKEVKKIVDDKTRYPNWDSRGDIKAELKVDLVLILAEYGYPPVDREEVYNEIFEQAENFKKHQKAGVYEF